MHRLERRAAEMESKHGDDAQAQREFLAQLSMAELESLERLIEDREAGEWSELSDLLESDRLFMASIGFGEPECLD